MLLHIQTSVKGKLPTWQTFFMGYDVLHSHLRGTTFSYRYEDIFGGAQHTAKALQGYIGGSTNGIQGDELFS
jgi:hypothetical protein